MKLRHLIQYIVILASLLLIIGSTSAQMSSKPEQKLNYCNPDSLHFITAITGDSAGDMFGTVTSVGDVNGDGYDDILVGACEENYAKLFFGGSVFDTIPDIILKGENLTGRFGHSVAGGKDLNGDGYPDFVIGAPLFTNVDFDETGKVYIFYGGPELDSIADMELLSIGWYYRFGWAVSLADDLNNDGCPDLIVGAPWYGGVEQGRVFIYYGGSEIFDSTSDVIFDGKNFLDMFGYSVSEAGDVNRDGYNDLIIGAPQSTSGLAGKAYLLFGSEEGLTLSNSKTFFGDTAFHYGQFGRVVAGLGDVNGDGLSDVGVMGLRKMAVIFGDSLGPPYQTAYLSESIENGHFVFIAQGEDFNADGYDDFLVSTEANNSIYTGRVVIFFGAAEFDTTAQYEFVGPQPTWHFGSTMAVVGKLSDDLKNCVVVGDDHAFGPNIPGNVYFFKYNSVNFVEEPRETYSNRFQLYQNHPNPFNPSTEVSFVIGLPADLSAEVTQSVTQAEATRSGAQAGHSSFVTLKVYDVLGREIALLVNERKQAGEYKVTWNAEGVPNGVYFYRIVAGEFAETKKMILIR